MNKEISKLAGFILKEFPDEIGKGNFRIGESAVDVAIRLLTELKSSRELLRHGTMRLSP